MSRAQVGYTVISAGPPSNESMGRYFRASAAVEKILLLTLVHQIKYLGLASITTAYGGCVWCC